MKKMIFQVPGVGIILIALSVVALSCQKSMNKTGVVPAGQTGLKIFLTDDPALSFDDVFIDIQKLEVKAEDSADADAERRDERGSDERDHGGETSGGWMTLDIHPGVYDILQFRNGLDTLFASGSFPSVRSLKKIRLTLGTNNSVVINGNTFPLSVKNKSNIVVINLSGDDMSFDQGQIRFSLDFDAGGSIRLHGDKFELDPHVRIFSKEKASSIEGVVLPAAAQATVMAISGTDTATAKPEREGEYKLVGLKPGTYSLLFHATANNYLDTTLNNIVVAGREDVHVRTVTLHQ
ncbi:MAG: DUF4382 domain-containing protein [Bacteroidota bacterium]|nr:DUF4382 domain-containing protein [Bacteroidota bacterium]MDP4217368.1 DUF4382 domain-containing protein [Bacteroidota bacterium]MDP4246264.1 DUF4382 domain-containing protein [Bacteroidota bacterium]MDP4252844.1 DUF4382 domain-containing protein [Bacteroidota bacterium]MDP4259836.1 DUF4382 domain-containing protein [Bacteroidota bacterium]